MNFARTVWTGLSALTALLAISMLAIARGWQGDITPGQINALALFVVGVAVMFLLLARLTPGRTFQTQGLRFLVAIVGGVAANVNLTWGCWALRVPIDNGTVRRGLMESNYWLGPAILAYAVIAWLSYTHSLRKETR